MALPTETGAYVEGLRDTRRALAKVDVELAKGLRRELKTLADAVRDAVRAKVPEGPRPKRKTKSGQALGPWKAKIGSGATQQSAYVVWGRKTVPYAGWLEFGGRKRVRGGGTASRPRIEAGRYVYPTVKNAEPQLVARVEKVIEQVRQSAGLD